MKTQTKQEELKLICVNCNYGYDKDWVVLKGLKNLVCPKCNNKFKWEDNTYKEK